MKRYVVVNLLLLLAFTVELRAENAVRFSDATVEPGGRFSVEMLIENDVLLGGATVPFRWSSPDITFDSAIVRPERWEENIRVIYQQTNFAERFSALTFIRSLTPGETGWIPVGSGSIASLHFTISASAPDQYAFIDSVYHVRNGNPIRWVNWSSYDGQLIAPTVYGGRVTIGNPNIEPPEEFNFSLGQNRPSPFAAYREPETSVPFVLAEASHVEIAVYDILGRRVATLTSEFYGVGEWSVVWDGRNARGEAAASGHYICRMATSRGESSRVIVLIR